MIDTITATLNDQRGQRPRPIATRVPPIRVASDSHGIPVRPDRLAVDGAVVAATSRYSRNELRPAPITLISRITPTLRAAAATVRQRRVPRSQPPRLAGES